jgi:hypothetical protein
LLSLAEEVTMKDVRNSNSSSPAFNKNIFWSNRICDYSLNILMTVSLPCRYGILSLLKHH